MANPIEKLTNDFTDRMYPAAEPPDEQHRNALHWLVFDGFELGWRARGEASDLASLPVPDDWAPSREPKRPPHDAGDWPGPGDEIGLGPVEASSQTQDRPLVDVRPARVRGVLVCIGTLAAWVPERRARSLHRKLGELLDGLEARRRHPPRSAEPASSSRTQDRGPTVLGDLALLVGALALKRLAVRRRRGGST